MESKQAIGRGKGGAARAAKMTPEERSTSARKAAVAKSELAKLPQAKWGSPDSPLKIGNAEIQCYVLEDGTRVLSQEGFLAALGRAKKARGGSGASLAEDGVDRLPGFLSANNIKPFITNEILESTTPIAFKTSSGTKAYGYKAELLPLVCRVYLEARDAGLLLANQKHLAYSADILIRGLAVVGISSLVDEATGYQRDRAKNALAKILEEYIAKDLQPWVKTFDADFYEEMFRLRGLKYPPEQPHFKPQYFGILTNDIVYKRLAPGVLDALKDEAKKADKKGKLHQHLTAGFGRQNLLRHLGKVVALMNISDTWDDFLMKLDRVVPRLGDTRQLDV